MNLLSSIAVALTLCNTSSSYVCSINSRDIQHRYMYLLPLTPSHTPHTLHTLHTLHTHSTHTPHRWTSIDWWPRAVWRRTLWREPRGRWFWTILSFREWTPPDKRSSQRLLTPTGTCILYTDRSSSNPPCILQSICQLKPYSQVSTLCGSTLKYVHACTVFRMLPLRVNNLS